MAVGVDEGAGQNRDTGFAIVGGIGPVGRRAEHSLDAQRSFYDYRTTLIQ